jgi:hypothetical protein
VCRAGSGPVQKVRPPGAQPKMGPNIYSIQGRVEVEEKAHYRCPGQRPSQPRPQRSPASDVCSLDCSVSSCSRSNQQSIHAITHRPHARTEAEKKTFSPCRRNPIPFVVPKSNSLPSSLTLFSFPHGHRPWLRRSGTAARQYINQQ